MSSMELSSPKNVQDNTVVRTVKSGGICRVCGRICSSYLYYGAICCEGCKQFFRRFVLQPDNFSSKCLYNSNCDVTKAVAKCRHCRYQKCLVVGMDRKFVKIKSPTEKHDDFLDLMKPIERAFKRIWDSSVPLPEAYTNRHQNLAELLQDKHNLLGNADQFPEELFGWDKAQFIEEVEKNGMFSMHEVNIHYVKDWFLMVELAKTFPFLKELDINDQICVLNHIGLPARGLINSFYSHAIKAKSVTRKNGLEILAILEAKQIRGDDKIRSILTLTTSSLIEKMSEIDVNNDEFLLLLAILLANPNADGLSKFGRKKLYQESIHFSKALQKLLHCKFGFIGGSEKFASLMNLLGSAIGMKFKFHSMFAYMEVFYTKRELNYAFPQIMQAPDAKSSY